MECTRCSHHNPAGQKFCGECGAPLAAVCASCGTHNPPTQKFCGQCGGPLGTPSAQQKFATPQSYTPKHLADRILDSRAAVEGERKQVSVLFADLKGSMELLADRDPEEARRILDPVLERMMEAVHRYEGTVNQAMGDGIMALFGAPLAHEDHAVRACYAALRMQESVKQYAEATLRDHGLPVRIRVGLNSGEVVVRAISSDLHMDYTAVGQTTHLAARMEQLADPGGTLLTAATLKLAEGYVAARPRGKVPVRGMSEPVEVFELTGAGMARTRFQAAALRGLTRFVGREREVELLIEALERVDAGHGQIAALVGEPGVGKSRLAWEFTHSHLPQGWLVLESGSVSYGKASAYRPVIDLLKSYFRVDDRDDARRVHEKVAGKLLTLDRALEPAMLPLLSLLDVPVDDPQWQRLDPPQKRTRILDACRHLLLRESRVQPLMVVFEDLHWIDNETQVFLDGLVDSLPAARILMLVDYRPEYHNRWTPKTYYTQIRVDPLAQDGAQDMLDALLGRHPRLASLRQTLIDRTDGNPFFLEESVRALVETGALAGGPGAYVLTTPSIAVDVPATVQGILAARIDRLAPEDKHLLQAASVIGKDVPFVLLEAIADMPEPALREGLARLKASEFLYEVSMFPDLEYTFKHALTHDVAYASLLLERRRALHAQILGCMESLYADRLVEHIERLAHHAMRGEVWSKAVVYTREAGEKAFGRSANRAAAAYFEESLLAATHLPSTREVVEQTIDLHHSLRFCLVPLADFTRMLEHTRRAAELSRKIDDPLRLAWSHAATSIPCTWLGRFDEALVVSDQAMSLSRSLSNRQLSIAIRFYPGWAHSFAGNLPEALENLGQCAAATLAGLEATPNWRRTGLLLANGLTAEYLHVFSQSYAAWCLAEAGRFDEGIARGAQALEMAHMFDRIFLQATALVHLGAVHVIRGDAARALPLLERALLLCQTAELPMAGVFVAVRLGQAYKLTGQPEEAVALLEQGRDLVRSSTAEMIHPLLLAHLADAYSLTGRGEEASTLARQAVEMARAGKMRGHEAWALYLLAQHCARDIGPHADEASQRYAEAIRLSQTLGMRPLMAQCRLGLAEHCGRHRQIEMAREQLAAAAAEFSSLGMPFWLERTRVALTGLSA